MAESIVTRLYDVHDRMQGDGLRTFVQRSDFVTRLAAPLVVKTWKANHGHAPKPRDPLSDRERDLLTGIIDATFVKLLGEANEHCGQVTWELVQQLNARESPARLSAYSERISIWVRQQLEAGQPPESRDCHAFAQRLVDKTRTERPASAIEFRAAYSARYDRSWLEYGAANLTRHPPAEVGIGANLRPPLVRTTRTPRQDWSQGTSRPIFERYRLWFMDSATVTSPRCGADVCQKRVKVAATDAGLAEVARACHGYGLAHPEHRQAIRSLFNGLERQWAERGWTTWARWSHPCRPINMDDEHDPDLADAMASAVAAWTTSDAARPLILEYGSETFHRPLQIIVLRKAWMELLGYERTFTDPVRRCAIPKMVRTALYRLAPKALREWLAGTIDLGEEFPPTPEEQTVTLLTEHPEVARLMLAEAPSWRSAYEGLVSPAEKGEYLTADQALELLRGLVEGMDS